MKLKNLGHTFEQEPYLTTPIDRHLVETLKLQDFDKDGYEILTPLEKLHYEKNKAELNEEIQFHTAPVKYWYIDEEEAEKGLVLDHCMLLTRFAFAGEARAQLEEVALERPILYKLLGIKPKWGIDFSLDYISQEICMEVIHIEQDFDNLEEAVAAKQKLENIIETTDWQAGAEELIERKSEWIDLSSDDHSDYKAQFFGWHRAFDNRKVFSS
jgi:hypothetical protein